MIRGEHTMIRPSSSRREAMPLACALGLALLAATAAPALSDTAAGPGTASGTAPSAKPTAANTQAAGSSTAAKATTVRTTAAESTTAKPAAARRTAATPAAAATAGTSAAKPAAAKTTGAKETAANVAPGSSLHRVTPAEKEAEANAKPSGDEALRGDREGTVFKSLTVEGEDRIHVDFERPELKIDLDLEKAPGLEWGSALDVLNRDNSDLEAPLAALSAAQMTPYLARPWLSEFATGAVARFHPEAQGVERWKLVVVNSKGMPVQAFSGKGDPPHEIVWDGRSANGTPVTPGLTYSYVFEAYDRAGNKRNVVGQGFTVTAYRLEGPEGPIMVFSASELANAAAVNHPPAAPGGSEAPVAAPIILEVASWLNQSERIGQPIRVTATARSRDQADQLANDVRRALTPLVLGDPGRLSALAVVEPDAPEAGTLSIAPGK